MGLCSQSSHFDLKGYEIGHARRETKLIHPPSSKSVIPKDLFVTHSTRKPSISKLKMFPAGMLESEFGLTQNKLDLLVTRLSEPIRGLGSAKLY